MARPERESSNALFADLATWEQYLRAEYKSVASAFEIYPTSPSSKAPGAPKLRGPSR